ncbi:MAG: sugar phosphate isomerase/epimerase [Candidatus Brockarchaeota archaeon]|nr:sugar phosphate isomerase/epimerase [Candidatus Brockarchaeota archaeon]
MGALKRGVNAWCFPDRYGINEVLENAARIGYDGVELNLDEEKMDPFKMTEREARSIREKAESLGLKLPSLSTGLFWKYDLGNPDRSVRERGAEIMRRGCRLAAELGAKVLLVVPAVASPNVPYEETWRLSKETVLSAADEAESAGVILGIENVWNHFLYSPVEFKSYLKEIGHKHVKAYFDVGNVWQLGFPQQWIGMLGKDIACVHVKDYDNESLEFKPLLEGNLPWREVMAQLRHVGYDYFLNVEVSPYRGDELKCAIDSKAALDILLRMA